MHTLMGEKGVPDQIKGGNNEIYDYLRDWQLTRVHGFADS